MAYRMHKECIKEALFLWHIMEGKELDAKVGVCRDWGPSARAPIAYIYLTAPTPSARHPKRKSETKNESEKF